MQTVLKLAVVNPERQAADPSLSERPRPETPKKPSFAVFAVFAVKNALLRRK